MYDSLDGVVKSYFATLGEIITKVTGQPYHQFLQENILEPLGMTRTLDDGQPYNVPLPEISASTAMGPAGGLMSTANDLVIYYKALMKSWRAQNGEYVETDGIGTNGTVFNDVLWLFAPLQVMETPTAREKSYAAGWCRSQLPTTVGDIGVNPGLVKKIPKLADGINLVGTTSFVTTLSDTESAVVVLGNTMSPNDAPDWIGQMLVETLLNSPCRNDYVRLASQSVDRALTKYVELSQQIEEGRQTGGPERALKDYVGPCLGFGGVYCIKVIESGWELVMLFQGLESQRYRLQHHHDDAFTWFMTWNDQIKRAHFINYRSTVYSIYFEAEEGKGVASLKWVQDPRVPEGQIFVKQ
ncbi:beta-lactamase/transpeptidase-like protein [Xylaria digitata]|nr:beta-lactamase/transpeptidase-like protein [Xylaria digitata]